jgi:hypothetical protein
VRARSPPTRLRRPTAALLRAPNRLAATGTLHQRESRRGSRHHTGRHPHAEDGADRRLDLAADTQRAAGHDKSEFLSPRVHRVTLGRPLSDGRIELGRDVRQPLCLGLPDRMVVTPQVMKQCILKFRLVEAESEQVV